MKKLLKFLTYYALIPFFACLPGFALNLCGLSSADIIVVPAFAALIYYLRRSKLDLLFAAKVNGRIVLLLLMSYTVLMLAASGNVEGSLMASFGWLIVPFAPIMLFHMLMGQNLLLHLTAMLTYAAAFAVSARLGKDRLKKPSLPRVLAVTGFIGLCLATDISLYLNRPTVKYAGHGFDYMHGYSSTDFSDYMVYSPDSKLVAPDTAVSFTIEDEKDMPVLDGAEACYPLYAAFARAVYKDIDLIEKKALENPDYAGCNGKIVSFTNSVAGLERLLRGAEDAEKYGGRVDMFFGARPSRDQLAEAAELGIELSITPIGREAFVFFVEEDNPVDDLTAEQLRAVYHGDITNWNELGGKNQKILAFQRPKNSGSQTMMEYFMGDLSLKEPETYETIDAMAGVIRQVAQYANEKGALGYSFRYFLEGLTQEKGVKMLSVDGVYPSPENIENGSYPLVTDVCLITRKDDPNPYVQKMTDFILSEQGQDIVRKTGYGGVSTESD